MKGNVFPMLEIICPAGCGRLRASRSLPHINSGGKGRSGTKGEWAELVVSQTFTRLGKIRTGSKGLLARTLFLSQTSVQIFTLDFLVVNSPVF